MPVATEILIGPFEEVLGSLWVMKASQSEQRSAQAKAVARERMLGLYPQDGLV